MNDTIDLENVLKLSSDEDNIDVEGSETTSSSDKDISGIDGFKCWSSYTFMFLYILMITIK